MSGGKKRKSPGYQVGRCSELEEGANRTRKGRKRAHASISSRGRLGNERGWEVLLSEPSR